MAHAGCVDATGAGGTYNYLETINGGIGIFNRSGARLSLTSYQAWFGVGSPFFNPVTQWDSYGSRFLFSIIQQGSDVLWLSVAQQPSATGKFCNYSFTFNPGHDFDHLGVDSDGIYFSANLINGGGQKVGNELFFASRLALESCQTATYTNWTNLTNPDGSLAEAITPARQDSSANGVEYLVNSYPSGACQLTLWTLTSAGNLSNTSVPTQCYSPPTKAKQQGSVATINTGDCSITQASYVHGLLTLDMPGDYDFGDGNGTVGIVEWYVLDPSTASVSSQGPSALPVIGCTTPRPSRLPTGICSSYTMPPGPASIPASGTSIKVLQVRPPWPMGSVTSVRRVYPCGDTISRPGPIPTH